MNQIKKELLEVVAGQPSSLWMICENVLALIFKQDESVRAEYLKTFLTEGIVNDECMADIESFQVFFLSLPLPPEKVRQIMESEQMVVSNLVRQRIKEEDFYSQLWIKLADDSFLLGTESKCVFLQYLWLDSRIPYYEIGEGVVLSNEDYRSILEKIQEQTRKGYFILDANLEYKTQRSSLLLDVASGLANETERIVFWADLLARLQATIHSLQEALTGREEADDGLNGNQ